MQFDGAVIKEQGVTFAIVVVKHSAVMNNSTINSTQHSFQPYFPGMPIVLMSQDSNGRPTYYGRKDIVNFLANVFMEQIPWKTYTV